MRIWYHFAIDNRICNDVYWCSAARCLATRIQQVQHIGKYNTISRLSLRFDAWPNCYTVWCVRYVFDLCTICLWPMACYTYTRTSYNMYPIHLCTASLVVVRARSLASTIFGSTFYRNNAIGCAIRLVASMYISVAEVQNRRCLFPIFYLAKNDHMSLIKSIK